MVKSACGIEAVYMCFNGTGIWGGETIMPIFKKLFKYVKYDVILSDVFPVAIFLYLWQQYPQRDNITLLLSV